MVPTPSLSTATVISCPRRRASWMGGRSRRGVFLPTRSVASSSSPKYCGCRSEMCRKPFSSQPKSTKAAWMDGSTLTTLPT